MAAVLRNNAVRASSPGIGEATLDGGDGDGRAAGAGVRPTKVRPKARYSHDPAAELMPAAEFLGTEPDFSAILEDFRDSPFNPQRRRVLGRLAGVFAMDYQAARSQERAFLRRLLLARNAREGYAANRALHLGGASHAVRRTLALGVAEARWETGPIKGFLGAVQARSAATTFILLGAEARELIWNLLTAAGHDEGKHLPGADPVIERALILKAVGARRHRLGPWSVDGRDALEEVTTFAGQIRGCWRETLAARTTLWPGDQLRVAKCVSQVAGAARAATIARGEIDPVFAWQSHGVASEAAPADARTFEDIYQSLPDLDRSSLLDRPRMHQALAEARARVDADGLLNPRQIDALGGYMTGANLTETRRGEMETAIKVVLERGFDVMSRASLEAIREDARGIYRFDAANGLGLLLSRYTGAVYVRRLFSDQLTAGIDPVPQIVSSLRNGLVVPLIIRELRLPVVRAWAAFGERQVEKEQLLSLRRPAADQDLELPAKVLLQPKLPESFGKQARADVYLAPAALDLLAPPFGIPFPSLGIEDRL